MRCSLLLGAALAAVLLVGGCSEPASEEVDFGTVSGSTYANEYFGLEMDFTVMGQVIHQHQYATISKGYALLIAVSFVGDDPDAELQASLDSIRFR